MTTSFSDALTTIDPNNSTGLGANWMQGCKTPSGDNANTNGAAAKIAVATKDGVNALTWVGFGAANPLDLLLAYAFPIPTYVDLRGLNQFTQCTNVKLAQGADSSHLNSGLMVQFVGSLKQLNAYVLMITTTRTWNILRVVNSAATNLASGSAGADGDVWKITSNTSNPAQVVVEAFRNGSSLASVTDTTIFRLNRGSPALYCQFDNNFAPAFAEWRTFSVGTF